MPHYIPNILQNNSSMRSYEDKNVNPYSGLNSPLKRLRPPPLVNPSAFVTPPSRSPSPCFAPRDSPSNFRVPQPPPIVIQPMSSPPAVSPANTPKASQQSRPSPGSKAVSVKTSPSHAPKYGSPVTPKASQNTPKSSSDPYSYANTKPYPPPPAPVTPKGQNTRSAPVTPKTGPSTATSAQRKKSIPSNSSTSKNGTLRTVPSPAILKAVPPPPPPVMTSGLTVSGLRRLSFRLLNQIDGTAPDTVLGALSAGKPRSPRSPRSSSFHASTSQIGQEQMEEASFTRYFSDDGVREEKFFIESRTASPRTGAATMPPSGVVMREVMAISQRNTPKSGDSSHTPRLSGTPKRFSFITSNLFGPEPDQCEGERSDSYIHLTVPNSAVTAALAMSPRAGEVDNGTSPVMHSCIIVFAFVLTS